MPTPADSNQARVLVACTDDDQRASVELTLLAAGLRVLARPPEHFSPQEFPQADLVVASGDLVARFIDYELPILALVTTPNEASRAFQAGADALSTWPQDRSLLAKQILCLLRSARKAGQLRRLAYEDELTGLASRSYFMRHLDDLIRSAERENHRFCLLYLDLDSFKEVNDDLGHDAGDELLRIVAGRLVSALRRSDLAARLGGDEFCILATGLAPDGAELARRCLERVSEPILLAGRSIRPRVSIGIAYYPENGRTATALLKAADRAMYDAKHSGGQRHVFYSPALTRRDQERRSLQRRLHKAFERGDFALHYQPQVNLDDGTTRGVEALLRWSDRNRLFEASEFIDITESTGLIRMLGLWVLEQACRQSVRWLEEGDGESFKLSVNLSTTHLHDPDLTERIDTLLGQTGWPPTQLELEIRGEAFKNDRFNHLGRLQSLGIGLVVDDFGNGDVALAELSRLPVHALKIDGQFIRSLDHDPQAAILTGTLLGLARSLGLELLAENVESTRAVQVLAGLGCNAAQGYAFSPPLPPDRIPAIIQCAWFTAHGDDARSETPSREPAWPRSPTPSRR